MKYWLSRKRSYDLLKGFLMFLMGGALLFLPEFTLISVTRLVAALLIVKGAMAGFVIMFSRNGQGNGSLFFEFLIDLGIGLLILFYPGGTISFFVVILAIWALLGGLLLAFSFNSLRRLGITSWGLFFNSIVALSFGLALLFEPLRGGLALATIIGVFALVYGIVNLFTAITKNVSHQ
jgi:uncharacterized membrane protein HdeD (DUF308 family)